MLNNRNCYEKCQFYYYYDNSNKYHCTNNFTCPRLYNKLVIGKNRCIDYCYKDNIYQYEINNKCYNLEENISNLTTIIEENSSTIPNIYSESIILTTYINTNLTNYNITSNNTFQQTDYDFPLKYRLNKEMNI